jgi:hypothetical protein
MTTIAHIRHYNARVHQSYSVDVPDDMLTDSLYFDENGESTPDFDAWACDNGRLRNEEVEPLDDWDLNFGSEVLS